jgi:hypothetical protein
MSLAHRLVRDHRLPMFVVGDMNEKQTYFRDITASGTMVSAAGGSHPGVCPDFRSW